MDRHGARPPADVAFCFDAFSSRGPGRTSLENAMTLTLGDFKRSDFKRVPAAA
jgi:hypothetical protein